MALALQSVWSLVASLALSLASLRPIVGARPGQMIMGMAAETTKTWRRNALRAEEGRDLRNGDNHQSAGYLPSRHNK